MPTLEQLRYEALADAVERATAPASPLLMFTSERERLDVRVHDHEGRQLEFQLLEVDLDANQLVGRDCVGAPIRLPLPTLKAVWQRRRLVGRSLSIFFGTLLVSAFGGAVLSAGGASSSVDAAVYGAFFGAIAGFGLLGVLDHWGALYQWKLLYERAAA